MSISSAHPQHEGAAVTSNSQAEEQARKVK